MSKYRKKPVVVEAITFDELVEHGRKHSSPASWVRGMPWSFEYSGQPITHEDDDCYLIPTIEGTMKMMRGGMLITGVKGEIYPCKPEIFAATYEPERLERNTLAGGGAKPRLECNTCGNVDYVLRGHEKAGDQCPCCFIPDRDCDGTLVEIVESPSPTWRPMETAPKDGTPVLVKGKCAADMPHRIAQEFAGLLFVARNNGGLAGWQFAAPVGMGGISDNWLVGWMPLPE